MYSENGSSSVKISNSSTSSKPILYRIIEDVKDKITEDDLSPLNIHDRLQTIKSMLNTNKLLPIVEPMRIPKSNDESLVHQQIGDILYNRKIYDHALYYYNKSIAFAENNNQLLYRLYEKRATVLREEKLFGACLHSIDLAIKSCPNELKKVYRQQQEKYIIEIKSFQSAEERIRSECKTDIDRLITLSYKKHPKVPFIADCLQLHDLGDYGRGITTKCDLEPGNIVAIESPYASTLYHTSKYHQCANCLKENWSLIPCPNCTTVMYCNEKCLEIAKKKFHKHECKISNILLEIFPNVNLIDFRIPLQTIELFGGIDRLIEYEEEYRHTYMNVFNVDDHRIQYDDNDDEFAEENPGNVQNYNSKMTTSNYHSVHGLIKDVLEQDDCPFTYHLFNTISTFLIYDLLCKIFKISTDNQKRFTEEFIYRHVGGARRHNHQLHLFKGCNIAYGEGAYPFASLINHSCAPNTTRIYNGSKMMILVKYPIKAGDQLFTCYSPHYLVDDKNTRQARLALGWNFICECIACTGNYQDLYSLSTCCLPYESNEPLEVPPATNLKLKDLIKVIKALYEFIVPHMKLLYPCTDIGWYEPTVDGYLSDLLQRLSGTVHLNG